jgi:hypothetical protein
MYQKEESRLKAHGPKGLTCLSDGPAGTANRDLTGGGENDWKLN